MCFIFLTQASSRYFPRIELCHFYALFVYFFVFHSDPLLFLWLETLTNTELPTIMISAKSLWFSVLHYACTLKTMINLPCPVIFPYGAVLLLHTITHSSPPRPYGLKVFAEPVNCNGAFFPGGPGLLWGWYVLPMQYAGDPPLL